MVLVVQLLTLPSYTPCPGKCLRTVRPSSRCLPFHIKMPFSARRICRATSSSSKLPSPTIAPVPVLSIVTFHLRFFLS